MKNLSISTNRKCINTENLFFTILILAHLFPIWVYNFFPSQDGPVHLANARILHDLLFSKESSIFHEFFIVNKVDLSNWLSSLILVLLNGLLPATLAEKVFLSGYIVLFPLSVRFALRSISKESAYLSFMIFPFVYNYLFHMGFYSYIYSLIFFFYLIGFWLRCRGSFNFAKVFALALLALLTYLFHIVSFVLAFIVIAVLCVQEVLQHATEEKNVTFKKLLQSVKNTISGTLLAFVPTLLCIAAFLFKQGTERGYSLSFFDKLKKIIKIEPLYSFQHYEEILALGIFFLFASIILFALKNKTRFRNVKYFDSFFVAALCSLTIYFIAPDSISGGSVINPRLALYPFFILILWFGGIGFNKTIKRYIVAASISFAFLFLVVHSASYSKANKFIHQYVSSFHHIQNESTLLPVSFKIKVSGDAKVNVFLHLNCYITAEKAVVSLDNYQAGTGYFPIKWKEELNPDKDFSDRANALSSRKDVEYVLLWGDYRDFKNNSKSKLILGQLAKGYNLVYRNRDKKILELYKKNHASLYSEVGSRL